ncbi:TetR/AcrR family transcriptional regulator [Ornithinimicrobium faecis]|uniref:TetR/AcrR family transcriptional regulator n=1 Tax=Ornithinimicrobium faecis TaxID=2934158 RepID=UPI002117E234|nr:TetR/AcrR family transcriptional regulator [Ornithinimicrobium sp. HY1745]
MTDEHPVARSLRLLWHGLPATRKGPRPSLTLEQIVLAGIAIADADGLDALSMRALARELGVGTMSLYRYVQDKAELMNLVLDHVTVRTVEDGETTEGWRTMLATISHDARRMYLAHPWLLQINWSTPVLGPGSVGDLERTLSCLTELPFSDRERIMLVSLVDAYVTGSVRQEVLFDQASAHADITNDEFWELQLPFLEAAMESGRFPTMAGMADDSFEGTWKETFELGLDLLLDGVEREVTRREAREGSPPPHG